MILGFGAATERLRERAARRARGPLAEFYAAPVQPASTPADALRLLAIDLETTGLDPARDVALSVGFVPLDGLQLTFSGAGHFLVQSPRDVGQSATLHGITDDAAAAGLPREDALGLTLDALRGRVLLAHFATIETAFLSRACEHLFGAPLVVPVIDTMTLMHRMLSIGFDAEPTRDDLRLWRARERYGLPTVSAHNALSDAVACGELYLGELAELTATKGAQTLKSLRAD